jgi:ketosteroid isomerase-like protein
VGENPYITTIRRYYDGCNRGDVVQMTSTFAPDITHYFVNGPPIHGAAELAAYWTQFQTASRTTTWTVDHAIVEGDEAVIEWTMISIFKDERPKRILRGAEWYVFRDGKIAEIRAYYHQAPLDEKELVGFPYAQRGYPMLA